MNIDTGGPAFPANDTHSASQCGATLRDFFAAAALTGFSANEHIRDNFTFDQTAEWAFLQADAMLAERQKAGAK